jgi:DNA invertase Pin-like site-specific DNA recombinase
MRDEFLPQRLRDTWEPGGDIYAAADEIDRLRAADDNLEAAIIDIQRGTTDQVVCNTLHRVLRQLSDARTVLEQLRNATEVKP